MNRIDGQVPAVKPNSILGRFISTLRQNNPTLYEMLFGNDGALARPVMQRLWEDRIGGLALWVLGVRSTREIYEEAKKHRYETQERLRLEAEDQ